MAGNKNRFGPNVMTVQEATNSLAQRRVIRVSPTLQAAATDAADVAFNGTEIPNAVLRPGGCSKLVRLEVMNYTHTDCDFDFIFTENTVTLGTVDSGVSVSDADLKTAKILGHIIYDSSDRVIDLINGTLGNTGGLGDSSGLNVPTQSPLILQAAENSTSVYVSGIDRTGADIDDLQLIFHIEY